MGWPKKNEFYRLYYERKNKTYLLVEVLNDSRNPDGSYQAYGELLINNDPDKPTLCETSVSPMHIYKKCRRVSWKDVPGVWQKAFLDRMSFPPEMIRGFWKIGDEGLWKLKDLPLYINHKFHNDLHKVWFMERIKEYALLLSQPTYLNTPG